MTYVILLLLMGASLAVSAYCAYGYASRLAELNDLKKQLYFKSKLVDSLKVILVNEAHLRGIINDIDKAKDAQELNRIYNDVILNWVRKKNS